MAYNLKIPKLSSPLFLKKIKAHKLEDLEIINFIEKKLIKERGYVFKMPKPRSPVAVSFSGGLDSTVLVALLLSRYKLILYPFYIADQPRSPIEIRKAEKLIKYFDGIYPGRIKPLKVYFNKTVGGWAYRKTELDFTNRNLVNTIIDIRQHLSLLHTQYVFQTYGIKLNTIFCGIQYHDGNFNPAQTLTGLRTTLLNMCIKTKNYDWQFASLFLEKELGFLLEKVDLIKIGAKMNLPLEKTWSCFRSGRFHCGRCGNCYVRKEMFSKAGVLDKTLYGSVPEIIKTNFFILFGKTKHLVKKLLIHVKLLK